MIRSFLPAAIVAIIAQQSLGGSVVISDGTFDNADWSVQRDGSNALTIDGLSSAGQIPLGGNPGAYRETISIGRNGGAGGVPDVRVFNWNFYTAETYTPADSGAILSLDYSDDSILTAAAPPTTYVALRQDGFLFRSSQSFVANSAGWTTNSLTGLVDTDFTAFFNGNFIPTAHPDFSDSGSEIEFGLIREHLVGPLGRLINRTGLDNWSVELTTEAIPEPSSLVLTISVLGAGLIRRRT